MNEETLKKAQALKHNIEELDTIIGGLKWRKYKTDQNVDPDRPPYNCFLWKLRALNLKREDKPESAHVIIYDNQNPRGTEINVDEDFLDYIIEYFKRKKAEKEKEFEDLA